MFFTRSGFTGSSKQSTLFWDGDQLVTWDNFDGLQTVRWGGGDLDAENWFLCFPLLHQQTPVFPNLQTITVRLSAGLSGISLAHSDIGG